jgi:hypothetical protein
VNDGLGVVEGDELGVEHRLVPHSPKEEDRGIDGGIPVRDPLDMIR